MMERNVEQWNLSNPMQAYQAALFLFRLKRSEQTLLDAFEKRKGKLVEELISGKWQKWTKNAHFPQEKRGQPAASSPMPSVKEENNESISELNAGMASVGLAGKGKGGKK